MPNIFCPKCERFFDSPWKPGWRLKNHPCPACKGPGKMGITQERVREEKEALVRWKDLSK